LGGCFLYPTSGAFENIRNIAWQFKTVLMPRTVTKIAFIQRSTTSTTMAHVMMGLVSKGWYPSFLIASLGIMLIGII
jgi:hypothetical protein